MSDYFASNPEQELAPVSQDGDSSRNDEDEPQSAQPLPPAGNDVGGQVGTRGDVQGRQSAISPGSLLPVLAQGQTPPPSSTPRFLHGGSSLHDLAAASFMQPTGSATATSWRAFTDEEEERLQAAWEKLDPNERMTVRGASMERKRELEVEVSDPDNVDPRLVPVGLDSLFSVDLVGGILFPDFWTGNSVRVILAPWFYAPPSSSIAKPTPSHQMKVFPVDPVLAAGLETAYNSIRPWDPSYASELESALKLGAEAEAKLKVPLLGGLSGGVKGVEVIFKDESTARVYSTGLMGSVGKSFLSSTKGGHGGGQVVIRGWDALRDWKRAPKNKALDKKKKARLSGVESSTSAITDSENEECTSPLDTPPRSRTSSMNSQKPAPPSSSGFFSALKSKLGVVETVQNDDGGDEIDATEEALDGPRELEEGAKGGEEDEGVGPVDELVLVVHGIGQKLAGTYSSFDFVHAVNSLRTTCTNLSTDPNIAPLLSRRRAQFIPVRWRTDLTFDDVDESGDKAEEELGNRYTLDDIELKDSVPFVRQVVSGLVLDVPFYLSHHKEKMTTAVAKEANRIYRLFCARNPSFVKGGAKVSIIAHSLGSVLSADILSSQPTFVKPLDQMTAEEKNTSKHFVFDTRLLILAGSPLAFFLHLGRGQLIARRGRKRSKGVAPDIALDRAGRYGCLAIDSIYNCYHQTDPVAFALNPAVDAAYSKLIKPIAIPSTNQTLVQNLTETYNRVSALMSLSALSLWSSTATTKPDATTAEPSAPAATTAAEAKEEKEKVPALGSRPMRPRNGMKRMPSERPGMRKEEAITVTRAEKRFKALNPQGCVDFYLPAEGLNQYVESLSSHGSYWHDPRFAIFVMTQLFSSDEELDKTGREQIGTDV